MRKLTAFTVCVFLIVFGLVEWSSADTKDKARSELLFRSQLAEQLAAGREVIVKLQIIPPNSTLGWHRHPGEAFHYYLDGEVTIEREGMEPIVGTPGKVGHVPYRKLHRAVAGDKGAKVLIFRVHVEDEPESYLDSAGTSGQNSGDGYSSDYATSSDSVSIAYDKVGEGKPALVLVHGWSNDRRIWNDQLDRFSDRYTVVSMDLAGFGQSGSNRQKWTMSAFGEDVKAVVKELNLKQVVLVGFSLGAAAVIEAADKLPEPPLGVVIVDFLQNPDRKRTPEMAKQLEQQFWGIVTNPPENPEELSFFFKKNQKEAYRRMLEMHSREPKTGWKESLAQAGHWLNEDCTTSLAELPCPLIAINSDHTPTDTVAYRKYVPGFEVKIIHGSGHAVMWDAPEEFNRLLEESIQEFMKN
jgi:sigma-B regulation protein RsbQ